MTIGETRWQVYAEKKETDNDIFICIIVNEK